LYDGKNIKVLIKDHPYRGKTCGICGNNDKEKNDEFEGPARCIFEEAKDFVAAYSMAGEHCEQVPRPEGQVRCHAVDRRRKDRRDQITHIRQVDIRANPTGQTRVVSEHIAVPHPRSNEARNQREQDRCGKMRTEYVIEGDMVCFTTKPVNSCNAGCRATAEQEQQVEFHCLPKASPFTKQLQQEADRQVLKQLSNKRIDFRRVMRIPVRCLAA
jgi:hypothetical protein